MKTYRPLTAEEIKILDSELDDNRRGIRRQNRFLMVWLSLCLAVGIASAALIDHSLFLLLAVTIVVFVGIGLWNYSQIRSNFLRGSKDIEALKAANEVMSISVIADKYYSIEEDDDEGAYYLFQLGPDKLLFFGGQQFYPGDRFPNSDFEIVEGRVGSRLVFSEIHCRGVKVKPSKVLSGEAKSALLAKVELGEFNELNGKLEDFAR